VADAARTPSWHLELRSNDAIVATRESGVPGMPWTVVAQRGGRGMRVSAYEPGDDTSVEGDPVGEIAGNPRDMGRQFRDILAELEDRGGSQQ